MASFVYYYKTPDDARHEGEIEAPDRDAAFAALRARGIRAIKVEPKGWVTGKGYAGAGRRGLVAVALAVAAVAGVLAFLLGRRVTEDGLAETVVVTEQGPVRLAPAAPLERQAIQGSRQRIEGAPTNLFATAEEVYLSRFAEPGRPLPSGLPWTPAEDAFRRCLKEPIRVASSDYTEHVDLKRIVAGMKREAAAYLAGGGTAAGYFAELVRRQKMEIAYREKALSHLEGLLARNPPDCAGAYAYWLKANAQLKSMGIYELPLPEGLRAYQLSAGLDE